MIGPSTQALLAHIARTPDPEEIAKSVRPILEQIDTMCSIFEGAGIPVTERRLLPQQLAYTLSAMAYMKRWLKQVKTALGHLDEAQAFLATCRDNPAQALETGAMRDAQEWVKKAHEGLAVAAREATEHLGCGE